MNPSIVTELHDHPVHGAVVVKRASDGDAITRLGDEAEALRRAQHPGVVTLAYFEESTPATALDGDGSRGEGSANAVLATLWEASRTVETLGVVPVEIAAGLAAGICATLSDLHSLGLVHGHLTADHVLVTDQGRPVLCSVHNTGAAHEDVAAVGGILRQLVGDTEMEPIPDRRRWSGIGRGSEAARRALLTLADLASTDEVDHRPAALDLARSLIDAVPGARLPDRSPRVAVGRSPRSPVVTDTDPVPVMAESAAISLPRQEAAPPSRRRPRRWLGAVAGILLSVAVPSGWLLRPSPPNPRHEAPPEASRGAPRRPKGTVPSRAPSTTTPASKPCPEMHPNPGGDAPPVPAVTTYSADVDGDGCLDTIVVSAGTVAVGELRYQLGAPGDEIVIGDWMGHGRATPAVLQRSTGNVFVFRSWPVNGNDITVQPSATAESTAQLVARHRSGRTGDDLLITHPNGTTSVLNPARIR